MSEARIQKLLLLFFILALFGLGLDHIRNGSSADELESKNPIRTEQIHVDQEFSAIH